MGARLSGEVRALIDALGLAPHPEGGFYRETFRDSLLLDGRSASTAIYFLLPEGVVSRWHRVDAVETWHWYAGAPLDLRIAPERGPFEAIRLGPDVLGGERPQAIVTRGAWQQAISLGAWSLAGCTVAPGFTFEGFEIAPADFEPPAT